MKGTDYTPLISIVVPMYNVEKYIAKCIDSIIGQSYRNIELILVDDGSPDNSGHIADDFSKKDDRIKVIHKENQGVSIARNLGIEKSIGEYIVFVDGDDYLDPDYVEYMLGIVEKTNADFVMSKDCFKFPGNLQQIEKDKIEIYTPDEAAALLLYPGYVEIGCWNKMFYRDFLVKNKLSFLSEFYMGEGLNFIVVAAQLSKGVGVGNRKVYYYRKDNLNSATTVLNVPKFANALAALDDIEKKSMVHTSQFKESLELHRYLTTFVALSTILSTESRKVYQIEYKTYLSAIRKDALSLIKADVAFGLKIRIWMYCISPKIVSKIFSLLRKMKKKPFVNK
ncbi:glycosyltransferase family 2 protein [Flavobacterium pectinovorum]|uniref:glycosyltransferase family 2 protein n=1 Tax=Flavobacterium pectinovorum TaxID=29533 RepID=UPI001FABB70C|nr:glycosyltransferase family 2 protein [Flavobacterium pectinovorum]MCI9846281.1 glycosyltransferase family 2 protein [Flavobacterium pectinovorum]